MVSEAVRKRQRLRPNEQQDVGKAFKKTPTMAIMGQWPICVRSYTGKALHPLRLVDFDDTTSAYH
ncbi:hypothetical protein SD10_03930 [Spirosoma radiotolerans]|uniref:Uncharacterized protein n=2 Tax=Spirosoma radiotolerans TaxID=1379870 RepID=A0A0E3V636_9BACT|nr:hypothetical protein SD10_03930 [Spirosoma radiotolerans]